MAVWIVVVVKTEKGDRKMTLEQFNTYMEQSFDAFCKKVIRNESRNIHKRLKRQAEHERALSSLSGDEIAELFTEDGHKIFSLKSLACSGIEKRSGFILHISTDVIPCRRNLVL